jgi:hypothetical protein
LISGTGVLTTFDPQVANGATFVASKGLQAGMAACLGAGVAARSGGGRGADPASAVAVDTADGAAFSRHALASRKSGRDDTTRARHGRMSLQHIHCRDPSPTP